MKYKTKSLYSIAFRCLFLIMLGLILIVPATFAQDLPAQAGKNKILIPREAFLPLGALPTENPALFDVVTEPVQTIKSNVNPVVFSVIIAAFIAVFVLLFIKFKKHLLPKGK